MNVVFISPHFPEYYHNFCSRLKDRGVNVLGVGDCPYDMISDETKNSLTEYYYVGSLENYDEVYRACAYFSSQYGKIDWIESENEYWLELEATLRRDFNVTTGPQIQDMRWMKYKSAMKEVYKSAGLKVADYIKLDTLDEALEFTKKNGYPVIVKPDNGVGATHTYKLKNDEELKDFYNHKQDYIDYVPNHRLHGKSKYSLKKMVKLAWDGISSFSLLPLRIATVFGVGTFFFCILYIFYALYRAFFTAETVSGWASLIVLLLSISAVQFIFLGILGEYIGKIFMSSKHRPYYFINKSNIDV